MDRSSAQKNTLSVLLVLIFLHFGNAAPLAAEGQESSFNGDSASECTGKEMYWDSEQEKCMRCTLCPIGWGSTHNCGFGSGRRAQCRECEDGVMFQTLNGSSELCQPCTTCDGQVVEAKCTPMNDTVCGPCKDGFGRHPGMPGICSLCKLFNKHELPPECHQTEPTVTSDTPLKGQGSPFPLAVVTVVPVVAVVAVVAVVVVVVVILIAVVVLLLVCKCKRRHRSPNQPSGDQTLEMEILNGQSVTNGVALANGDVPVQSNKAPDKEEERDDVEIHDTPTEMSILLAGPSNPSIDDGGQNDHINSNLKLKPIQEESGNESGSFTRPVLDKIPTRLMADDQKPKEKRKRFYSAGDDSDAPSNTSLPPEVLSKCIVEEQKLKEQEFEVNFQKACSCGRGKSTPKMADRKGDCKPNLTCSLHWEDLEPGTRKRCTQLMTSVDRSSSNAWSTLGEMLKLNPRAELKECKNLEDVFDMLHKTRSTCVNMDEVLQKLREMPRMDVVRVLVEEIIKKKPTRQCVS